MRMYAAAVIIGLSLMLAGCPDKVEKAETDMSMEETHAPAMSSEMEKPEAMEGMDKMEGMGKMEGMEHMDKSSEQTDTQ